MDYRVLVNAPQARRPGAQRGFSPRGKRSIFPGSQTGVAFPRRGSLEARRLPYGDRSASCGTRKTAPSAGAGDQRSAYPSSDGRFEDRGTQTAQVTRQGRDRAASARSGRTLVDEIRLLRPPLPARKRGGGKVCRNTEI